MIQQKTNDIFFNENKKNIVITGGNWGIGFAAAKALYKDGHNVIFGSRNINKNQRAVIEILKEQGSGSIHGFPLDLSKRKTIEEFADSVKKNFLHVDIILNNASLMIEEKTISELGIQMMITVNHMGHFYLTYLLLDLLKKSKEGRVINISSSGYVVAPENYMEDWEFERKNFSMLRQYLSTKLLNILFTVGLANYFEKNNLNNLKSAALNPGGVNTKSENSTCFIKICMTLCCCLFKKPDDGVKTHLHLCNIPFNELQNGKYYDEDQKVKKVEERATNHENVQKLWAMSEKAYGIQFD